MHKDRTVGVSGTPERILITLVGGSCLPVIRSIKDNNPDHIIFICSEQSEKLVAGDGDVCGECRACPHCGTPIPNPNNPVGRNIVVQAGAMDAGVSYQTVMVAAAGVSNGSGMPSNPVDHLQSCLDAAEEAFRRARALNSRAQIFADYTGGTKTMSVALVRVATGQYASERTTLSVVAGKREGLTAVLAGTESVADQQARLLRLEDRWHEAISLANHYRYSAAEGLLKTVVEDVVPSAPLWQKADRLRRICSGLDAWDRFEFAEAAPALSQDGLVARELLAVVDDLATIQETGRRAHEGEQASATWETAGLLPVYDLLNNAGRRKSQGRYDDGVMRLYRVLEMVAQNRLWYSYAIDIDDINPKLVPDHFMKDRTPHDGKYRTLGLADNYRLLRNLRDPIGQLFSQWSREHTREGFEKFKYLSEQLRNKSYLAHGTRPVSMVEYDRAETLVRQFVDRIVAETGANLNAPQQFPKFKAAQFE